MVSEVIETPAVEVDPAVPQETETEAPAPIEDAEGAAPEEEPAATEVPQAEVEAPKPEYLTREEWEREKADVAAQAARDAIEQDRKRRQTENARKANAEKRDAEERAELQDTVKAAFGAQGIYEVPDEAVLNAIDRTVRKRSEQIAAAALSTVEQAFDYIVAPITGTDVELDDAMIPAGRKLAPKVQSLIDALRPRIEAEARKGYVAESDIPKLVEAEIAKRAAKAREGQPDFQRPEGQPATTNKGSIEYWESRIAREGEEGHPDMSASDWATYKAIRRQHGLS